MLAFRSALFIGLFLGGTLEAQVEQFFVVSGLPLFGEQPLIQGNLVVWQRYTADARTPDMIQCRDISRMDNPVVNVTAYPAYYGAVVLGPTHLFWDTNPVRARPVDNLAVFKDITVSPVGHAVAATEEYVFLEDGTYNPKIGNFSGKFFAKSIESLSDPSPDAIRFIAEYHYHPYISRYVAASGDYFVWEDRNPDDPDEGWKIYAEEAPDFFTPGKERLVADTHATLRKSIGVYLALHQSLLLFQAQTDSGESSLPGIFLLDLRSGGAPTAVATTNDPELFLTWPAISERYAIWTVEDGFFVRRAYAVELIEGRPSGQPFLISGDAGGGSWITIDRNIAVWNGVTSFGDGGVSHQAIVAAELPLAGANDVGDVDQDGWIGVTDAIIILDHLFRGGWKPRLRLADTNGDREILLSDAIVILDYAFQGGPRPGS